MPRSVRARACLPPVLAGLVVAALASTAAPPRARAEPLPAGRIAGVIGARTGTGSLYNSIGTGLVVGIQAGYAPLRAPQTIGLGLSWSLLWSYYGSGSARVADSMAMVELDAGVRVRMMLGPRRRNVVFVGGGAALTRTNEPLFAGDDRSYVGPWGAIGVEGLPLGALVSASVRFGVIGDGQGTIGLMLSAGVGR
ncbi:MAG: hypothetical protein IPL61_12320 [Myxococcales bacterium]|nr:hypothetical protein [Myxococcales bacterium]